MPLLDDLRLSEDASALAASAAEWLCETLAGCERAAICLAGGETPRQLYRLLAATPLRERLAWERIHWFWGDERFVPHDAPESNYRMAWETMLHDAAPPENLHPVPTDLADAAQAAAAYDRLLRAFHAAPDRRGGPLFDVTLLGLGEDGHTASLFPGSPALDVRKDWAAAVVSERPEPRVTLTFPALEASGNLAFLVAGARKRPAMEALRRGAELPPNRLRPQGHCLWFVDREAAP